MFDDVDLCNWAEINSRNSNHVNSKQGLMLKYHCGRSVYWRAFSVKIKVKRLSAVNRIIYNNQYIMQELYILQLYNDIKMKWAGDLKASNAVVPVFAEAVTNINYAPFARRGILLMLVGPYTMWFPIYN